MTHYKVTGEVTHEVEAIDRLDAQDKFHDLTNNCLTITSTVVAPKPLDRSELIRMVRLFKVQGEQGRPAGAVLNNLLDRFNATEEK